MRPILLVICWATLGVLSPLVWGQPVAGVGTAATFQTRTLDALDSPDGWKIITSDAVTLEVTAVPVAGASDPSRCLRLDYHFTTGAGYAIIQKPIAVDVPENYELAFRLRGDGPANNLEFKLLDDTGDNVWWQIRRAYEWPKEWTRLVSKKRDIEFAWGPLAGAPLKHIAKVEFAISSNSGGKGTVWVDELTFRELPRPREKPLPLRAASEAESRALDGDATTVFTFARGGTLTVDQGEPAEFGGVELRWAEKPETFSIAVSEDKHSWTEIVRDRAAGVGSTIVPAPNAQARYIQIRVGPDSGDATLSELKLRPAEFSTNPNAMLAAVAKERVRGHLPRQFLGEQSYWTVVGADGSTREALINEEGQVEVGKRLFSIEPVIRTDGKLLTWADGQHGQSLREGHLPIPTVTREHENLTLTITPFVSGEEANSTLYVMYSVRNTSDAAKEVALHLCVRPFQVNPPWQRLNFEGGVSQIRTLEPGAYGSTTVNGEHVVMPLLPGARASATSFASGDIVDWLSSGAAAPTLSVTCADGLASGAISYDLALAPGEEKKVAIAYAMEGSLSQVNHDAQAIAAVESQLEWVAALWRERLSRASITVPKRDAWLQDAFKAQLAYILINRDGPAIQPGSRSYERSWARDGSLTSAALLSLGHPAEVRAWIDWYGEHLFENGKVPCVVDTRGPDPVPEHDSHGQYIWAVANYYRHTGDREFLKVHWPRVQKVVAYIQSLRAERMTEAYKTDAFPQRACYGLVPESISHEGYSAKPMHSYWDDFFILLGLREAVWLAGKVGEADMGRDYASELGYAKELEDFTACLRQSIERTQSHHKLDYIPGCVELGDFDATSTTIALFPCNAEAALPPGGFGNTFDRYWAFASGRAVGLTTWDGYTPYEWRTVGAFVRLDQRDRAYALMQWFKQHQRPQGWHHWAEVVFSDPLSPRFIGDMPHTWCGSDFLNSVISMFAYESNGSLTLFAGVPQEWLDTSEPAAFQNFVTPYGTFSGSIQKVGREVRVKVSGERASPGGPKIGDWENITIKAPSGVVESDVRVDNLPFEAIFHLR
jgi:hypothetical protein